MVLNEDPTGRNPHPRMTLTYSGIARARLVIFTVEGEEKQEAFAGVQRGDPSLPPPRCGPTGSIWLVDPAAAALVPLPDPPSKVP